MYVPAQSTKGPWVTLTQKGMEAAQDEGDKPVSKIAWAFLNDEDSGGETLDLRSAMRIISEVGKLGGGDSFRFLEKMANSGYVTIKEY